MQFQILRRSILEDLPGTWNLTLGPRPTLWNGFQALDVFALIEIFPLEAGKFAQQSLNRVLCPRRRANHTVGLFRFTRQLTLE